MPGHLTDADSTPMGMVRHTDAIGTTKGYETDAIGTEGNGKAMM